MINRTSPYRVEINPWTLDATLHEAILLRGAYVSAFGTIETNLTELAIRASKHDDYKHIRGKFPSRRNDRVKFLKDVCEVQGPLTPYRKLLWCILQRYEAGLSLRDSLAHGRMKVLSLQSDEATIHVEDYAAEGELVRFRRDTMSLSSLKQRTKRASLFSRCSDLLYHKLGDTLVPIEGECQGSFPLE